MKMLQTRSGIACALLGGFTAITVEHALIGTLAATAHDSPSAELGPPPIDCPGDLNADNAVNGADLSVLLANFGNSCGTDADNDGWAVEQGDCDDNNPGINPGEIEVCDNGIDDDCDGFLDTDDFDCKQVADQDSDGWTIKQGDCDDSNPGINPSAAEICNNGVDDDCDGFLDTDDFDCKQVADRDNDGWTIKQGDCDDNNPGINPGEAEICNNGIDDDCDGFVDMDDFECR